MKSFPMFIRTSGRRVVILGGSEQAAQKMRLMLKTDARLILAAPDLEPELQGVVTSGRAAHHAGAITPALFEDAAMAFVATGCPGLDAALHALVRAARCPVNVVDQPALCDLTTPSLVDRDPVVVAIGTEGTAPVLARQIKTRIEEILPANLGGLAAFSGRMRDAVAHCVARPRRRAFWAWVFSGPPRDAWCRGAEREAAAAIKAAIAAGGPPAAAPGGSIALVGAGPGARDLLTLRAVARLQEADVIFYDRLVDPEVLELARRDAERVFVGKCPGANAWPQDKINQVIVAEARKGRRVVRLKSGDPGIFGRLSDELAAARGADIPVEIVPGVTAASGAAAAIGLPLTTRGETDTLVLTTGQLHEDGAMADVTPHIRPGTAFAFYMAVANAGRIAEALRARDIPAETPVEVVVEATKSAQRHLRTNVGAMARDLRAARITGCAMILIALKKPAAAAAGPAIAERNMQDRVRPLLPHARAEAVSIPA
ncbi:uroporphyrin-III C-methyltransferase / precorrin-2 dehydrogenase / sirohydrochlorin ferrochelatase [Roseivivax lentus]|uniref:Uroporphyrin-III C-methyltransferase / precorrin-2 dehydrogenase / sirohydrochlorin ferrochelatase n=1 Tax=Roseivivax lentus TaxID=633194 RepID=A0A1N7KSH7_9RHOB|nr:siroheme synthase CysG [Roseivivax lentus]SIS64549.1 uroporphyrin-III C-methyltransferase / precorrin-2 dehydrogenase / sirohydrochlorin ferrochelatase [Roseivivax lentus]